MNNKSQCFEQRIRKDWWLSIDKRRQSKLFYEINRRDKAEQRRNNYYETRRFTQNKLAGSFKVDFSHKNVHQSRYTL